jgi:phage/plasmid-like protein (TIGR03299 family)
MAHNLDFSTGKAGIAFAGSRADIWHRHGQEMPKNASIEEWAKAAGLNWHARSVEGFAEVAPGDYRIMPGQRFIIRSDTNGFLGAATEQYHPHQPADVLDWFSRYIAVDERFSLDVAGALDGGKRIWATATFNGDLEVAGDRHGARLLMSTSFDGTQATINQGTMTRVVCNNTLTTALADQKASVRTSHRSKFDAARVGAELASIAQGFAQYKKIGDALAQVELTKEEVSAFFKSCLDIKAEDKQEDLSTRKLNQFTSLVDALKTTKRERNTDRLDAWAALNAITRYVDHDRSSRGGENADVARFSSSQFGSGAVLKAKAWDLLMPRVKELVAA